MNGPPTGFARFLNQTQMASFSTFMGELRWTAVTLAFASAAVWLLTRDSETMRATGIAVAGIVGTTLLGKSAASVVTNKNVRETSREYIEAKAKGEALATAEHQALPAVHADKIEKVEVNQVPDKNAIPMPIQSAPGVEEEHEWASGDKRAGVI